MSWLARLEEMDFPDTPYAGVPEVPEPPKPTFRHFWHPAIGGIPENKKRRYAYRFKLHNDGGGGVVLTDEPDLDKARASLAERYDTRLAVVTRATQTPSRNTRKTAP